MNPYSASRPHIPESYGVSRDTAGLVLWTDVADRLAASRNYWIATVRADGRPHARPVWGVVVAGRIVFGTDPASVTGRNVAAGSRVAVHLESGDEVVIVEGEVTSLPDDEIAAVGSAYRNKYGVDVVGGEAEAVYLVAVRPRRVFAWSEAEFPATATRFDLGHPAPPRG